MFVVLEMEPQIHGHLLKMTMYNIKKIDKLHLKTKYIIK